MPVFLFTVELHKEKHNEHRSLMFPDLVNIVSLLLNHRIPPLKDGIVYSPRRSCFAALVAIYDLKLSPYQYLKLL